MSNFFSSNNAFHSLLLEHLHLSAFVALFLTSYYSGDQRAPSSSLSWIDSISPSEAQYDSPCLLSTQGFATSESIALSSTEEFMRNSQAREENPTNIKPVFVQRVPQLVRKLYSETWKVTFLTSFRNKLRLSLMAVRILWLEYVHMFLSMLT